MDRVNHYYVAIVLFFGGFALIWTADRGELGRGYGTPQGGIGIIAVAAGAVIFVRKWCSNDGPY